MPDCYLLYIDILGFSELVLKKGRIEDLYDQIDTLNSHEHTAFKTLAFSDTILIYNTVEWGRHYLVMYLCEFAQDLFYRLVSRDLHFRAYREKSPNLLSAGREPNTTCSNQDFS
jgi:hypothetical protein